MSGWLKRTLDNKKKSKEELKKTVDKNNAVIKNKVDRKLKDKRLGESDFVRLDKNLMSAELADKAASKIGVSVEPNILPNGETRLYSVGYENAASAPKSGPVVTPKQTYAKSNQTSVSDDPEVRVVDNSDVPSDNTEPVTPVYVNNGSYNVNSYGIRQRQNGTTGQYAYSKVGTKTTPYVQNVTPKVEGADPELNFSMRGTIPTPHVPNVPVGNRAEIPTGNTDYTRTNIPYREDNSVESEAIAKGDYRTGKINAPQPENIPVGQSVQRINANVPAIDLRLQQNNTPSIVPQSATTGTEDSQKTSTNPYSSYQDNVDSAQKDVDNANQEQLNSLRDIINRYKPETQEEKSARERRERIARNIAGFASMGAALGNLASATSSRDGRSVSSPNLVGAVDQNIERQRGIRKEDDAKFDAATQQYQQMRTAMANQKYANAWNALINEQKKAAAAEEAQRKAAKDAADANFKLLELGQKAEMAKMQDETTRRGQDLRLQGENAKINSKNGNVVSTKATRLSSDEPLPIDGGKETFKFKKGTLDSQQMRGIMRDALPKEYRVWLEYDPKDKTTPIVKLGNRIQTLDLGDDKKIDDIMLQALGMYLNDVESHKQEPETWKNVRNMLSSIGAFEDNKSYNAGNTGYSRTITNSGSAYGEGSNGVSPYADKVSKLYK